MALYHRLSMLLHIMLKQSNQNTAVQYIGRTKEFSARSDPDAQQLKRKVPRRPPQCTPNPCSSANINNSTPPSVHAKVQT